MGEFIISFQFTECDMRIYLCGGERFVTEYLFHAVDLCAMVEHRTRKTVAKHMGAFLPLHAGFVEAVVHHLVNQRGIHRLAFLGEEQLSHPSLLHFGAKPTVSLNEPLQFATERHDAVFVALTVHLHLALHRVNIAVEKPDELCPANACAVENRHYQPVSHLHKVGIVGERSVEQAVEPFLSHKLGQPVRQFRQFDVGGGVLRHLPYFQQPFVEGSCGLHLSPHRASTVALPRKAHHPGTKVGGGDAAVVKLSLAVRQKIRKLMQIVAVGFHREWRKVSLVAKILQKLVDFHSSNFFDSSTMLLSATNLVNIPEKRKVFNQKIILFSILFHSKFFTLYIILCVVQKMSEAEAVLPPHPELY